MVLPRLEAPSPSVSVEGDEERGHPYKRRGGGWDRRLMSGKPGKGITFEM